MNNPFLQSNYYPKIIIPKSYLKVLSSLPEIPTPPSKPILLVEPKNPTKSIDQNEGCMPTSFGVFMIGLGVFAIYFHANNEVKEPFFLATIGCLLFGLAILYFNYQLKTQYKKDLPNKIKEYNVEIDLYNRGVRLYKECLEKYESDILKHSQEVIKLQSPFEINKHRIKQFEQFKKSVRRPELHHEIVKRGVSEKIFHNKLVSCFGNSIHTTFKISTNLASNSYSLYPDFVYYDESESIILDIEIDEPYIGSSGEPIHHLECSDDWRNEMFESIGWFVVRFSEEQVIRYPMECCDLIKELLDKIRKLEDIHFEKITLPMEKCWTKDEAHKKAFHRYRNTYLPNELIAVIKEEKFSDVFSRPNHSVFQKSIYRPDEFSPNDDLPF